MSPPKSRSWCFTLNNPTAADIGELVLKPSMRYLCYGKEVGESGTPHLQGFVVFDNAVRLTSVKAKVNNRAHVEIAKGSVSQNVAYCSKDGLFTEFGDRPMSQQEKGECEKLRYKRAWDLAIAGDLEQLAEESPDIMIRHYSTVKRICHDKLTERKLVDTEERMQWYYGPAGTGKSRKARTENPNAYLKNCNKWWDGFVDQDVVIVDDFDKSHSVLVHHLKHWGDRYPFLAEIKGASQKIRPKKIIVTSNYHPSEIWTEESDLGPILRRFQVTHFPSLGAVPILPPPAPQAAVNAPEPQEEIIDLSLD